MILLANFTIPGQPKPKERPRFGNGRGFTSKATKTAEALVASSFREQTGFGHSIDEPLTVPLKFVARFYRKNNVTADLDNLVKLITDALNELAWKDDKQIKKLRADYYIDPDEPRTEIEIWAIGEIA